MLPTSVAPGETRSPDATDLGYPGRDALAGRTEPSWPGRDALVHGSRAPELIVQLLKELAPSSFALLGTVAAFEERSLLGKGEARFVSGPGQLHRGERGGDALVTQAHRVRADDAAGGDRKGAL